MQENIRLTSVQNPTVKLWRELNKSRSARQENGLFLAEGEHMAGEALKEGCAKALLLRLGAEEQFSALCAQARAQNLPVYELSDPVLAALSDAKTPQGVLALCPFPRAREMGAVMVALDDVQDPGNVGTILRTLDAAGFSGMIVTKGTADAYSPKTLRASMGAVFRIPVQVVDSLADTLKRLRAEGYAILAGALDGEPFYQRGADAEKICVVIGNEGAGISKPVMDCATKRVKLPMRGGAESLNAAVACGILLYDILRNRGES